jgi:UDP-N-acetylmuramyl tripeptide synthase
VSYVALLIGKLVLLLGRLVGKRGSSFPGLVVERISPGFLAQQLAKLPAGVIVVTGTNGKTTTVKMIAEILGTEHVVLTNRTGANFTRGIASSMVSEMSITGKLPHTIAVFELDEAWAVRFVERFRPRGVLITNVMRDQMDRFGEIDHTARLLARVVAAAAEFVVLNADDPRVRDMASAAQAPVTYFGVGPALASVFISDDELYLEDIDVEAKHAGRPQPHYVLEEIGDDGIRLRARGVEVEVALTVFGSHNAQNATAALAAGDLAGIPVPAAVQALEQMEAAFGRGEFIDLRGERVLLQLVKNPGGFRYSLMDLGSVAPSEVLIAINDDYADGRDVSWLWDVDFRGIGRWPVTTTGTRAQDMALRLEYDGVPARAAIVDLREAIEDVAAQHPAGATIVICATYTAMFEMRGILSKMTEVAKI